MPKFRLSPSRRSQRPKKEDGGFNFGPPSTLNGDSYAQSDSDVDYSSDDDASYTRRFFRKSPTRKNRKGLQSQEKMSPVKKRQDEVPLDVGAHDVIETQFVPFHAIKSHYRMGDDSDGNDGNDGEEGENGEEGGNEDRKIAARRLSGDSDYCDTDGDDDVSFRSMHSLEIGAMNKAKRREFIKYHLRQESTRSANGGAATPSDSFQPSVKPSSSFTKRTILPSRSESSSQNFNSFQPVPSDKNKLYDDIWAPKVSLDEKDSHDPADFEFPSDPFAEFDAQYAVDVEKDKKNRTSNPVTNRVFGFTPTRPKKIIDRKKIEPLKLPAVFMLPPRADIDLDVTQDSSQIALASPESDRRKFRHENQKVSSPDVPASHILPSFPPSPKTGFHSSYPNRPMNDVNIDPSSDDASVSSSIGESIETAKNLPVLHMSDFMKLDEPDRVQAYCDLFELAADTMKDVEDKQVEIQSMGKKVDNLVDRVTEMENDKERFLKKEINSKKEILKLKSTLEANGICDGASVDGATLSSVGGATHEISMLRTELESKDIIIEALQRSMDEWKSQEICRKEAIERTKAAQVRIGDKSQFTSAEVEEYREQLMQTQVIEEIEAKAAEDKRDRDELVAKKDKQLAEQSALILKQKTMIHEARQEIQQKNRTNDDLRTDVSSRDSTISELKSKLSDVGDMVELEAVHAELEKSKQLVKELQHERDSCPGAQSVESSTVNLDQRSESAVQRAKRAFDIPSGTVRARVALAASRAIKNNAPANPNQDSFVKRSLATFNGSAIPSYVSSSTWKPAIQNGQGISEEEHQNVLSQLHEKTAVIKKIQSEMKTKISELVAENIECEQHLEEVMGAHKIDMKKLRDRSAAYEKRTKDLEESHNTEVKMQSEEKKHLEQRLRDLEMSRKTPFSDVTAANASLEQQVSILQSKLDSLDSGIVNRTQSSGKVTKEDENKFADLEEGYKFEIEGLMAEKKELKKRIAQAEKAHIDEIQRLVEEKADYKCAAEELQDTHTEEISRLSAEKQYFEQHISTLEQDLRDAEEMYSQEAQESTSRVGNSNDVVTHEVGEATCEAEAGFASTTSPASHEVVNMRKENVRLEEQIQALGDEIETVGGLLEETIMSIKEKDDEIEALRDNANVNAGLLGRFGGQGGRAAEKKKITNLSQYTDDEIKQLERICKLHQLTIIRQRSQANAMMKQLSESKADKEKIAVLEAQFVEVNKALESNEVNPSVSADSGRNKGRTSIIKVDATYVSSLEEKSKKDQGRMEELQNEIRILKERIETMKEKMNIDMVLRGQVDDLTMALEARELEITSLEEAYSSRRSLVYRSSLKMSISNRNSSMKSLNDADSAYEELTADELREIVAERDRMIKQLKSKVAGLAQVSAIYHRTG